LQPRSPPREQPGGGSDGKGGKDGKRGNLGKDGKGQGGVLRSKTAEPGQAV
jgi:hypothetical protein